MNTIKFVRKHWNFLGFGFLLTFSCNLGQTYFIGLYTPWIRESYGLSNADFGSIYGAATLCSAGMLIWIGRLIDHVDLRKYTLAVMLVMVAACLLMAGGTTLAALGGAIFLLRLSGQGLMPHISNISMGRYFEAARGRAVSIANLGISSGQIILPFIAAGLIAAYGWRTGWVVYAGVVTAAVIPIGLFLLKGHTERHRKWEAQITLADSRSGEHSTMRSPVRELIFHDRRFWILMPGLLSAALFGTSIFFYQNELILYKQWPAGLFVMSIPLHAVCMTAASLCGGFLIDRAGGSIKILPGAYLLFTLGLIMLALGSSPVWLPLGLTFIGASTGLIAVIGGTLWPEMYGTRMLGTVRSLVTSLAVLSTAATPPLIGMLYDAGISVKATYLGFVVYIIIFALLQLPMALKKNPALPEIAPGA